MPKGPECPKIYEAALVVGKTSLVDSHKKSLAGPHLPLYEKNLRSPSIADGLLVGKFLKRENVVGGSVEGIKDGLKIEDNTVEKGGVLLENLIHEGPEKWGAGQEQGLLVYPVRIDFDFESQELIALRAERINQRLRLMIEVRRNDSDDFDAVAEGLLAVEPAVNEVDEWNLWLRGGLSRYQENLNSEEGFMSTNGMLQAQLQARFDGNFQDLFDFRIRLLRMQCDVVGDDASLLRGILEMFNSSVAERSVIPQSAEDLILHKIELQMDRILEQENI